jgi:hypothetical protein
MLKQAKYSFKIEKKSFITQNNSEKESNAVEVKSGKLKLNPRHPKYVTILQG